jgi:hypothetical protein
LFPSFFPFVRVFNGSKCIFVNPKEFETEQTPL